LKPTILSPRMAIDAPQTIGACWDMTLKLDLTGLNCPLFAIKTRKDLKSLTRRSARSGLHESAGSDRYSASGGTTGDRLEGVERDACGDRVLQRSANCVKSGTLVGSLNR
jgi:hypothetical protein